MELHSLTLILDNDQGAYYLVQEVIREHWEEGPGKVGEAIIEALEPAETQLSGVGLMIWRESMSEIDAEELGEYYLEDFDESEE